MSDAEYELLDFLLTESGRPIAWLVVMQRDDIPEAHVDIFKRAQSLIRRGALPQVSSSPFMREIPMRSPFAFASFPSWHQVFNKSKEEQARIYADPEFRKAVREDLRKPGAFNGDWSRIKVASVKNPLLKSFEGQTVAAISKLRGTDGVDTFLDLTVEDDVENEFQFAMYNFNEARMPELLTNMDSVISLSDGGAHVDLMCDAAYPSILLGKWVREKQALSLELAVQRLTSQPADFIGLADRGRIQIGMAADIVVFDLDRIRPTGREVRFDLPAGGKRIVVAAEGIDFTLVNGAVMYENGKLTGATAGAVLRSRAD